MYKILMIEDDGFLADDYITKLEENGFNVDFENDINIFYEKAKNDDYDAIVLDLAMPYNSIKEELDIDEIETHGGFYTGLVVAKRLRNDGVCTKIIALSHSNSPEAITWFSQDNSSAFISKFAYPPLEFAMILKHILNNPELTFGELDERHALLYRLQTLRSSIPGSQYELLKHIDRAIQSLENDNSESFKISISGILSSIANIAGIISSIPTVGDIIALLSELVK